MLDRKGTEHCCRCSAQRGAERLWELCAQRGIWTQETILGKVHPDSWVMGDGCVGPECWHQIARIACAPRSRTGLSDPGVNRSSLLWQTVSGPEWGYIVLYLTGCQTPHPLVRLGPSTPTGKLVFLLNLRLPDDLPINFIISIHSSLVTKSSTRSSTHRSQPYIIGLLVSTRLFNQGLLQSRRGFIGEWTDRSKCCLVSRYNIRFTSSLAQGM